MSDDPLKDEFDGLDIQAIEIEESMKKLRHANEIGLAPYLDEQIRLANGRRTTMLILGFTPEDVSIMFEAIIHRAFAIWDNE